jgi:hypothetical protein
MVVGQTRFGKHAREVLLARRRPLAAPHHRLDAGTVCKP